MRGLSVDGQKPKPDRVFITWMESHFSRRMTDEDFKNSSLNMMMIILLKLKMMTMKMTMRIPGFRASIYFNFDLPWRQVAVRFDSY